MRVLAFAFLMVIPLAPLLTGQAEGDDDPYNLAVMRFELKANSAGQRMIHSWSRKRLIQLGDGASVALLKILTPDELRDPERVKEYAPIIQTCFSEPGSILLETNKDPKVTFFLLSHLQRDINDPSAQELLRQTEEFVRQKTAR